MREKIEAFLRGFEELRELDNFERVVLNTLGVAYAYRRVFVFPNGKWSDERGLWSGNPLCFVRFDDYEQPEQAKDLPTLVLEGK